MAAKILHATVEITLKISAKNKKEAEQAAREYWKPLTPKGCEFIDINTKQFSSPGMIVFETKYVACKEF